MKIYTKKGDAGETGLVGGGRVSKDDLRIRTYGTVDELNSVLGWALTELGAASVPGDLGARLLRIQGELFQLGAELATPAGRNSGSDRVGNSHIGSLEREIDAMESVLEPLRTFILPGGSRGSSLLHLARTVSRRSERELISLHKSEPQRPEVLQYMNRLSDYLFVCARFANHAAGVADVPWHPPAPAGSVVAKPAK